MDRNRFVETTFATPNCEAECLFQQLVWIGMGQSKIENQSTPLVLGMASLRGSFSTAIRMARAVALKTHSLMW